MNKVTVRLVGGLGNQLHCYAFGMALADRQNVLLEVDCHSNFWNQTYGKIYLLDSFPAIKIDKMNVPSSRLGKFLFRLKLKASQLISVALPLSLRPIVNEGQPIGYLQHILNTRYFFNPYFMGYWCSYRYYNKIEQQLRSVLTPPEPSELSVTRMLTEIRGGLSCFIHWRSYREVKGWARSMWARNMKNYYSEAIMAMKMKFPGIRFYVFSDHYSSARHELSHICDELHFVELEESVGDMASLNDFYLMYACDHAIIGNSSFSWWAAWLGDPANKTVVAPRGLSPWGDDWLPPHWLALDADS
jgi:hypothetical protein